MRLGARGLEKGKFTSPHTLTLSPLLIELSLDAIGGEGNSKLYMPSYGRLTMFPSSLSARFFSVRRLIVSGIKWTEPSANRT